VGLEEDQDAAARGLLVGGGVGGGVADGGEVGGHLGGVVGVGVDDADAGDLALELEAPGGPGVAGQGSGQSGRRNAEGHAGRQCGHGVVRVVTAGHGDRDDEPLAVELDGDLAGEPGGDDAQDAGVGVGGLAVRGDPQVLVAAAAQPGGQLPGALLVGVDHERAAGPDALREGLERLVDLLHRGVVGVVVQLDVEDDGDLGGVPVEAAVALVGLGDEQLAVAVLRVGRRGVEVAADRVRGAQAEGAQRDGEHGGRRGLAVGSGDGDRPPPGRQGGERLGAVEDGQAAQAGGGQLGVAVANGAGDHHAGGVLRQVRRLVAEVHADAQRPQRGGGVRLPRVAAGHLGAAQREDLGDARHARAADADEVRAFHRGRDGLCHRCSLAGGRRAGGVAPVAPCRW
jgi:hypothetical protein